MAPAPFNCADSAGPHSRPPLPRNLSLRRVARALRTTKNTSHPSHSDQLTSQLQFVSIKSNRDEMSILRVLVNYCEFYFPMKFWTVYWDVSNLGRPFLLSVKCRICMPIYYVYKMKNLKLSLDVKRFSLTRVLQMWLTMSQLNSALVCKRLSSLCHEIVTLRSQVAISCLTVIDSCNHYSISEHMII